MQRSNLLLFNLIEIVSILKVRGFRNDAKALGIITDNHYILLQLLQEFLHLKTNIMDLKKYMKNSLKSRQRLIIQTMN